MHQFEKVENLRKGNFYYESFFEQRNYSFYQSTNCMQGICGENKQFLSNILLQRREIVLLVVGCFYPGLIWAKANYRLPIVLSSNQYQRRQAIPDTVLQYQIQNNTRYSIAIPDTVLQYQIQSNTNTRGGKQRWLEPELEIQEIFYRNSVTWRDILWSRDIPGHCQNIREWEKVLQISTSLALLDLDAKIWPNIHHLTLSVKFSSFSFPF